MEPKITHMRFSSGPVRKTPKAGDMRYLKGRKVWQIRQQRRSPHGIPNGGLPMVSNGKPLWEWVDRHSQRDRQWEWTGRNAKPHHTHIREYFEQGCLCLIEGRMKIDPNESNRAAAKRYIAECTCSRKEGLAFEE